MYKQEATERDEQSEYVRRDIEAARRRVELAERELTAARYALGQYPKAMQ